MNGEEGLEHVTTLNSPSGTGWGFLFLLTLLWPHPTSPFAGKIHFIRWSKDCEVKQEQVQHLRHDPRGFQQHFSRLHSTCTWVNRYMEIVPEGSHGNKEDPLAKCRGWFQNSRRPWEDGVEKWVSSSPQLGAHPASTAHPQSLGLTQGFWEMRSGETHRLPPKVLVTAQAQASHHAPGIKSWLWTWTSCSRTFVPWIPLWVFLCLVSTFNFALVSKALNQASCGVCSGPFMDESPTHPLLSVS